MSTPVDAPALLTPAQGDEIRQRVAEAKALHLPRADLVTRLADASERLLDTVAALREERDGLQVEVEEMRAAYDRYLEQSGEAATERDVEIRNLRLENVRLENLLCTVRDHCFIGDEELLQGTVEMIDAQLASSLDGDAPQTAPASTLPHVKGSVSLPMEDEDA